MSAILQLMRQMDLDAPYLRKNDGQSYAPGRPWCVWVYLHGDQDAVPVHNFVEWQVLQLLERDLAERGKP